MVKINNQRKAFLDMLALIGGTDNGRQKTRNHGYDVIVGGELFTDYESYEALSLNWKLKSTAGTRCGFFPVGGMPTASSLAWKTSLRKSGRLWHLSRLRSVLRYLWLIVVISVRQSTVAAISGLHCRALVMVSSSIRLTAWLQNSKRAEQSEDWCMAESPRCYLRSGYLHHRLPVTGLLIITVITPLPTKPSATKMPERTEAGERGNYWHADASAWCCCARCKIHEEVADAKAENDALRDDAHRGRRRLHIRQSVSQCVKPHRLRRG